MPKHVLLRVKAPDIVTMSININSIEFRCQMICCCCSEQVLLFLFVFAGRIDRRKASEFVNLDYLLSLRGKVFDEEIQKGERDENVLVIDLHRDSSSCCELSVI